ncbi:uncharacterized protein LOC107305365 [Oryza brachyantha]|uniref:uncharacterized protein LOC107305365 n=1 Tax=Oryza brachyantha TaxID=4533 RepID=UPI001ADD3FA2|nr:uncharacterized protein LOC107305365 [Oryza brachyantha]
MRDGSTRKMKYMNLVTGQLPTWAVETSASCSEGIEEHVTAVGEAEDADKEPAHASVAEGDREEKRSLLLGAEQQQQLFSSSWSPVQDLKASSRLQAVFSSSVTTARCLCFPVLIWRIRRVPSHIQRRIVTTLSRKVRIPGMSCASCVVTALPGVASAVSDPFSCSLALARLVCPCGVMAPPAFVLCL